MILQYTSKPTILLVALKGAHLDKIAQIEYGVEEEGIPCVRHEEDKVMDVVLSAHEAATHSLLLVGIACDDRDAVLHYRTLKEEQFLYRIKDYPSISHEELRAFGSNAARLVKGIPFKKSDVVEVSF